MLENEVRLGKTLGHIPLVHFDMLEQIAFNVYLGQIRLQCGLADWIIPAGAQPQR